MSQSRSLDDGIRMPDHRSMPSDYSDVQPKSYDPEYISQISSQMQVPDRIGVSSNHGTDHLPLSMGQGSSKPTPFNGMTVPDRILVAVDARMNSVRQSPTIRLKSPDFHLGKHEDSDSSSIEETIQATENGDVSKSDNRHIGMKSDLALNLRSDEQASSEALSYVGLLTPPRTLTMEESFPVVDDEPEKMEVSPKIAIVSTNTSNGHVVPPQPYEPGLNPHDSLLLNDEDEVTLIRTQMSKLARRVQVIEEEHKKRAQREFVVYPVVFGYILWKVLGWLARDSRG